MRWKCDGERDGILCLVVVWRCVGFQMTEFAVTPAVLSSAHKLLRTQALLGCCITVQGECVHRLFWKARRTPDRDRADFLCARYERANGTARDDDSSTIGALDF
jgi:hypothetical protein